MPRSSWGLVRCRGIVANIFFLSAILRTTRLASIQYSQLSSQSCSTHRDRGAYDIAGAAKMLKATKFRRVMVVIGFVLAIAGVATIASAQQADIGAIYK